MVATDTVGAPGMQSVQGGTIHAALAAELAHVCAEHPSIPQLAEAAEIALAEVPGLLADITTAAIARAVLAGGDPATIRKLRLNLEASPASVARWTPQIGMAARDRALSLALRRSLLIGGHPPSLADSALGQFARAAQSAGYSLRRSVEWLKPTSGALVLRDLAADAASDAPPPDRFVAFVHRICQAPAHDG